MKRFVQYCGLLLLFCISQIFIFERIQLGPFFYPCVYVLFILLFPFGYNTLYLMLWAFAMGLSIDICTGMPGIHASASLCLGLLRPNVLKMVTIKGEVGQLATPGIGNLGWSRYLIFLLLSLLIHHTVLFGWESFRLHHLHLTIYKIMCSAMLNTMLISLTQVAFFNRKRGIE